METKNESRRQCFSLKAYLKDIFFCAKTLLPLPKHLWDRGVAQGDISPTCCQQRRQQRPPVLSSGKDDNEEQDWWLRSSGEEKVLYIAQPELKWVCTRASLHREKLGSGRPPGALLLHGGVRGADSLKIHLWQQSNKWPRLCYSLPVVIHHSASSNCSAPRSLFIILPQSRPRPPHLLPEGGKKKPTKVISSRKKRSYYCFFFFLFTQARLETKFISFLFVQERAPLHFVTSQKTGGREPKKTKPACEAPFFFFFNLKSLQHKMGKNITDKKMRLEIRMKV